MRFDYHGIDGFDISTWQDSPSIPGHVDFQKMKAWGARFVIIKAGQAGYRDPDFETNWNGAKGILPRSPYWFYDNLTHPKIQAGAYRDIMEGRIEGICWLDLEDRTQGAYMGWRHWYDFIQQFRTFMPEVQVGIYTGHYYFEEFTMTATDEQRAWFKQFPLWLASYTQDPFNPNYSGIQIPRPWTSCILLQSGTPAIGIEVGVESKEIDYNQFNGDEIAFAKYFGAVTPLPEPEPEELMQGTMKTFTNIRNGAGVGFSDIGDLLVNDIITSDRDVTVSGAKWYHLTDAKRNGQPIVTLGGLNVSQRADCWAYGPNIEPIGEPEPPANLPVFQVAVSAPGYQSVIVELRPL